ncbi:hypothetical protein ILUMI_26672 [Ignelater luminosus]|uniref:Uncharacterized protein n=1 Tax=Ignelater luminosus TaxID=2038154 RepID=A0A8K0C448_IGNLU|nr:hypothetical protein ILUMI_26672 [Ignelater luminosus]
MTDLSLKQHSPPVDYAAFILSYHQVHFWMGNELPAGQWGWSKGLMGTQCLQPKILLLLKMFSTSSSVDALGVVVGVGVDTRKWAWPGPYC